MRFGKQLIFGVLGALMLTSCAPADKKEAGTAGFSRQPFGKTEAGDQVELYTLTNSKGVAAAITNYGGILVSLKVPDRTGNLADVVLGFDGLDGYKTKHPYFGAIVGRYGNRIGKARFTLNGTEFKLALNDGENSLHGGAKGFDKALWSAKPLDGGRSLELTYTSKDGEEGFPGNLTTTVTYSLNEENELKIDYSATTDKDTVVNLTNHSYFNLAGQGEGDVLGHMMTLNADRFTPVDAALIPTGDLKPVQGTPLDFRTPHAIGERIGEKDAQIALGKGYDHNFVINRTAEGLTLAARVAEPKSGRVMEVLTTEPGVQFYTGNFLDGSIRGKAGKVYQQRYGFCLETQHFPDSPNKPGFPSVVLKPGGRYQTTTVYRFSAE